MLRARRCELGICREEPRHWACCPLGAGHMYFATSRFVTCLLWSTRGDVGINFTSATPWSASDPLDSFLWLFSAQRPWNSDVCCTERHGGPAVAGLNRGQIPRGRKHPVTSTDVGPVSSPLGKTLHHQKGLCDGSELCWVSSCCARRNTLFKKESGRWNGCCIETRRLCATETSSTKLRAQSQKL